MFPRPSAHIPALRECLAQGGVVVTWCGVGALRQIATQRVREEGMRLLVELNMARLHISRSACDGLGVLALSASTPVGVDVESTCLRLTRAERAAWLHPLEVLEDAGSNDRQAIEVWARKEAVLKALGIGLSVALTDFSTGFANPQWRPVEVPMHGLSLVQSIPCPLSGTVAALAVPQTTPPGRVVVQPLRGAYEHSL